MKFLWQSVIGLIAAVYLAFSVSAPDNARFVQLFLAWIGSGFNLSLPPKADLIVPFVKTISYPLGVWGFIALTYCVIVGTSNAVNLTDGLDGLAIMPTVMIGAALGIFAYVSGNAIFARYLQFPYIPGAGELAVICGAMAGAGLGFLWFNAYPAEVFMGDVGALALGAALGTIAVIVRQEIVLFIMGGVFVVETLSVMIQVASFKLTGKRVFRMAPIHHHYELKGWKENQVVVRFWIITMLLVLFGLSTLKLQMTTTQGRNAVVLGLGLTGYSLARHLAARGADVRVADTRATPPFAAKLAAALPARQADDRAVHDGDVRRRRSDRDQPGRRRRISRRSRPRSRAAPSSSATSSSSRARCRRSRRCSRSPDRTASRRSPR